MYQKSYGKLKLYDLKDDASDGMSSLQTCVLANLLRNKLGDDL